MKILRVVSDLYPEVVGGLGIHVHEMSKDQVILGHEVTIFTSFSHSNKQKEIRDGYNIERFKNFRIMGNSISITLLSRLNDVKNDFDIIHAHSHLFFSTILCAVIRKKASVPLVVTNHGIVSQRVPLYINTIYNRTFAKWIFKSADKIICYTEEEKSIIGNWGIDLKKIEVIHNGINTDLFTPKNTKKTNQLLWVGRFIPGKGVKYLIDAFKIVSDKHPHYKLLMVGNGPLKEDIEKRINRLGLEDKIEIKEFIPNSEIPQIYQNSDIFVLPSLEEGVPRTILEAMSCGIPIVCTNLTQIVNIVNDCGITVPAKNSHLIADAINTIIEHEEISLIFSERAREKVLNGYSWENTVKETVKLYEQLVYDDLLNSNLDKLTTNIISSK